MGEREIMKQISMQAKLHKTSVEVCVVDELGVVHSLVWFFREVPESKQSQEAQTEVSQEIESEETSDKSSVAEEVDE